MARHVNPMEKKPLFHFLPGTGSYSIATVGCNLKCAFCQNWEIAHWPRECLPPIHKGSTAKGQDALELDRIRKLEELLPGERMGPWQIVEAALRASAPSICYTFTEPTVFYELAYDTAKLARQHGLRNVAVTNGFTCEEPLRCLADVLDAANVDLKFFTERNYRRFSRGHLQPVLDSIHLYHQLGVWVEVTTLIIPGVNDSDDELRQIAQFIYDVGSEIPWHVSQFFPMHKMRDLQRTPVHTLHRARQLGLEVGLQYVYEGNIAGEGIDSTYCPCCGCELIRRTGFHVRFNKIAAGRCPKCNTAIPGVWS